MPEDRSQRAVSTFTLALAMMSARDLASAASSRPTRIRSHVETRAGTCERGIALWRVFLFTVEESEELKLRLRIARQRTIDRFEVMYRPELATLGEPERRYLLIALEALTEMESWARMREMYGMSFEEGCAVWIRAIDRMLPPTPQGK